MIKTKKVLPEPMPSAGKKTRGIFEFLVLYGSQLIVFYVPVS